MLTVKWDDLPVERDPADGDAEDYGDMTGQWGAAYDSWRAEELLSSSKTSTPSRVSPSTGCTTWPRTRSHGATTGRPSTPALAGGGTEMKLHPSAERVLATLTDTPDGLPSRQLAVMLRYTPRPVLHPSHPLPPAGPIPR